MLNPIDLEIKKAAGISNVFVTCAPALPSCLQLFNSVAWTYLSVQLQEGTEHVLMSVSDARIYVVRWCVGMLFLT